MESQIGLAKVARVQGMRTLSGGVQLTKGAGLRARKTLSSQVYEALKQQILLCQLVPGEMFFEGDIARNFNVSKSPVREAVKRLMQERLIQSIPGVGNTVTMVTTRDVWELFNLRRILETAAVHRAAELATQEQLREIESQVGETHPLDTLESHIRWHKSNVEFHVKIAAISGNRRLVRMVRSVMEEMFRLEHMNLGMRPDTSTMRHEHMDIVAALRQGNAQLAVECAMRSIDGSLRLIQQSMESNSQPIV